MTKRLRTESCSYSNSYSSQRHISQREYEYEREYEYGYDKAPPD